MLKLKTCTQYKMSKHLLAIAVVTACTFGAFSAKIDSSLVSRIIGGANANDGQFPHQISLKKDGEHVCSGSIISKRWVLTAAQCVESASASQFSVVTGTIRLNGSGNNYSVERIVVYDGFNPSSSANDIALVKTSNDIILGNNVATISIGKEYIADGVDVVASGWGASSWPPGNATIILQFINLKTISLKECKEKSNSPFLFPIQDSHLCTLTKAGEGACHGDYGGPLEADSLLVGILSFVAACALGVPDCFTRVSSFVDWIEYNAK